MRLIKDPNSGDLGVIEFNELPFVPKRIYWISNFKPNVWRGEHAHKSLTQVAIVLSGRLTIDLYLGSKCTSLELTANSDPLLIEPGRWRVIRNADPSTVLLVIADNEYHEEDYIRNWNEYLLWYENEK